MRSEICDFHVLHFQFPMIEKVFVALFEIGFS